MDRLVITGDMSWQGGGDDGTAGERGGLAHRKILWEEDP